MNYQHRRVDGSPITLPAGKVVCVGRNYAEHARELDNPVPQQPLLFIKPSTALADLTLPLQLPHNRGPVHYEAELAVLIERQLTDADEAAATAAIGGIGLALDLTLRELQSQLKADGHPWELAKAFDHSCPISPFVKPVSVTDLQACQYRLSIDGELRQHGDARQMLTPITALIAYISRHFTLLPGDTVLTGTPAGVGILQPGMRLRLELDQGVSVETSVAD